MSDFRADLHCHTTCSDGSMSPKEVVHLAKELGLSGLSITDHDTIEAYETAIPAAKEMGILLGSGVEFSSVDRGVSVHMLGYDFDLKNSDLITFCGRHIERRHERNRRILEKLKEHQMPLGFEIIESKKPKGRPHIAQALVSKGYVGSIQEAFDHFIGDGKLCFDPGIPISTDETLEIIHGAGGKAFIAHPHLLRNMGKIDELLQKPFDGIECYYSRMPSEKEMMWLELAKNRGLLISGGSDFHGSIKPNIPLGASWVDRAVFDTIFTRLLS